MTIELTTWIAGVKPGVEPSGPARLPRFGRRSVPARSDRSRKRAGCGSTRHDGRRADRQPLAARLRPADWLRAQYPHEADLIDTIVDATRQAASAVRTNADADEPELAEATVNTGLLFPNSAGVNFPTL